MLKCFGRFFASNDRRIAFFIWSASFISGKSSATFVFGKLSAFFVFGQFSASSVLACFAFDEFDFFEFLRFIPEFNFILLYLNLKKLFEIDGDSPLAFFQMNINP